MRPPLDPLRPPQTNSNSSPIPEDPFTFSIDNSPPASPSFSLSSSFSSLPSHVKPHAIPWSPSTSASGSGTRSRTGGRSRSSTNDSASGSGSGSGSGGEDAARLVMPSMRLPDSRLTLRENRHREAENGTRRKILILGRTRDERLALSRLLANSHHRRAADTTETETDMSSSFLSTHLSSDRSSNSHSSHPPSNDHASLSDDLFESLDARPHIRSSPHSPQFLTPRGPGEYDDQGVLDRLIHPMKRLEGMLRENYPNTDELGDLVEGALKGNVTGVMLLMSAPPLPHEVTFSRAVSHILPLVPVLILPPSPTSRPLKTTALISAVKQQLTNAGVRWIIPEAEHRTGDAESSSGIYTLPGEVLEFSRSEESEMSGSEEGLSPSSSQELPPLSTPSSASRSRSSSPFPSSSPSLARLLSLFSSPGFLAKVGRQQILAFMEWREIEVAARGGRVRGMREGERGLEDRWGKRGMEALWVLEVSRRVGERRNVLNTERRTNGGEREEAGWAKISTSYRTESPEMADSNERSNEVQDSGHEFQASYLTDPTTPRCAAHSPLLFSLSPSTNSFPSPSFPSSPPFPSSPYFQLSSSPTSSHSTSLLATLTSDPFHIPSLLHLVGLNLRLSLMPTAFASKNKGSNGGGWIRTLIVFGVVFYAGYAFGGGVASEVGIGNLSLKLGGWSWRGLGWRFGRW
ncbi:hypothetical protein P7C70_g4734, partial [Phenoliferia sp. Uapishka_3]